MPGLPSSVQAWRAAIAAARAGHDPARQRACVTPDAAALTATWLEALIARLWPQTDPIVTSEQTHARAPAPAASQEHHHATPIA